MSLSYKNNNNDIEQFLFQSKKFAHDDAAGHKNVCLLQRQALNVNECIFCCTNNNITNTKCGISLIMTDFVMKKHTNIIKNVHILWLDFVRNNIDCIKSTYKKKT